MKRIIAMFAVVFTVVGIMMLAGCNDPKKHKSIKDGEVVSVTLVVQQTANSQPPMLSNKDVTDMICESMYTGGEVVIIMADGAPFVVDTFNLELPQGIGKGKRMSYAEQATDRIMSTAGAAAPKTDEVDVLAALTLAARNSDHSADVNRVIYLGSALSTCGPVNFAKEALLYSDPTYVVNKLQDISAIPQFPENTVVTFAGVGDVCQPQSSLDYAGRQNLLQIWEQTCEAGGADTEVISASPVPSDEYRDFPSVSIVPIQEAYVPGSVTGRLDSEKVEFEPDDFTLKDPDSVRELLRPLAEQLRQNSGEVILISGSTATVGENESCIVFGQKRAETIKQVLVSLGVPEGQLITKGIGYDHPLHTPDRNPDGSLNSNAERNRCVFIYPIDSAEAKLLLDC